MNNSTHMNSTVEPRLPLRSVPLRSGAILSIIISKLLNLVDCVYIVTNTLLLFRFCSFVSKIFGYPRDTSIVEMYLVPECTFMSAVYK